jgi:DNA mismatch repair protein MutL
MPKIKELAQDLVNKIAAGEVVERPASAIKELIENAIDAEASSIKIELIDAGKKKIKISDNGFGMHEDDIETSLKRYATSKISNEKDLYEITTLGFRGEALPAIASISKLNILSREDTSSYGINLKVDFGKIVQKEKKASNKGTTITVEDLYYNTPARLKFLKTNTTELNHCIEVINNYAIAYPNIFFNVLHNNKEIINYPATKNLKERLTNIYNKKDWIYANYEYQYIKGEVYYLDPKENLRKDLKIFINGRVVKDKVINHAVNSFFSEHATGIETVTILFLNFEPLFIDVNVSPTKSEVRFRESQFVHSFIKNLLSLTVNNEIRQVSNTNNFSFQTGFSYNTHYITNDGEKIELNQDQLNTIFLGQFHKQYLIFEENGKIVVFDQHAVHERINFEKILKNLDRKEGQDLLIPELISFNKNDLRVEEIIPVLNELGYIIEVFDENLSFIVRKKPKALENINTADLIMNLLNEKIQITTSDGFKEKFAKIAARLSCHESIRGKRNLTELESLELIKNLKECKFPYICPHGRPTKIEISLDELEKLFKRK